MFKSFVRYGLTPQFKSSIPLELASVYTSHWRHTTSSRTTATSTAWSLLESILSPVCSRAVRCSSTSDSYPL